MRKLCAVSTKKVHCLPKKVDPIPKILSIVHLVRILSDAIHASLLISPQSHWGTMSEYSFIAPTLKPGIRNFLCSLLCRVLDESHSGKSYPITFKQ